MVMNYNKRIYNRKCHEEKSWGIRMKKVALIADCWRKLINFAWISGCRRYIAMQNLDVNLYVFSSFGNFSKDEKYNWGEYNIFNLPDLSEFDGIIVDFTNIEMEDTKNWIIQKVREAKVPAVSLAEFIDGMYLSGIDDYHVMKQMVEHIIEIHGCEKINFVGGPMRNDEARLRLKAYQDVMKAHGLECTDNQIYCKDYEMATGEEAFRQCYERGVIPEAFICANDNLAVGVCHEAKKYGYECPKDFLVTGFDNFDKAACYSPRITTVDFVREEIAYNAMQLMDELWSGESERRFVYAETPLIFQDSCGCVNQHPKDRGKYIVDHIHTEQRNNILEDELLEFNRSLVNCGSFKELAEKIPGKLKFVRCDGLHLLVDQEILEDFTSIHDIEEPKEYCTSGYPEHMTVLLSCHMREGVVERKILQGELFPQEKEETPGNMFLFAPLHFRDRAVGYLVFKNCDFVQDTQLLFDFTNTIQENMQNLHARLTLQKMNEELSLLYIRDSLTGLYNRMAYSRKAVPLFEECRLMQRKLAVMFVDVDRLKYINDTFGHDAGNVAITSVATAIEQRGPKDAIAMRYGGDEFVVLIPDCDKEQASDVEKAIRRLVETRSLSLNMGFDITASIGYTIDEGQFESLNDAINEADGIMYEDKKARRMRRED